ncbi:MULTISPECIES: flavin reductase family protein [unclassified Microbacterium]|uniref:flavin reductase family protein n=1 Tax=unclassified Microbacterium TaxID=2609290 RepID=UPI00214B2FEC|nr:MULTISPECIES: flavin reductase family protein [unclassified Microbacterium]MCR2808414.1 flavin reductase family protein [Microbacterium sp. zg.B185]WIM19141.1 flavin reductase family protein [Microbacterium sp. zg-B185]
MTTVTDPQRLRDVLGNYPTGVSVITGLAPDGQALAMVVGTFTSVSLDPPLVAFLPMKSSSTFAELRDQDSFVVNIVAHDQEELVRRLARSDRTKMDAEAWDRTEWGNPVLRDVVATVECARHSILEAGDHYIVLGLVENLRTLRPTTPLVFFRGGYGEFAAKSFVVPDGRGLAGAVSHAQALRADLERGASQFGGEITVFARISGDSVAIATATEASAAQITPLGTRYPIAPPIGAQYVAWADEQDQQVWIDKAVGATPAEREALRRRLEDVRTRGWGVNLMPDAETDSWETGDQADDPSAIRSRHAAVTRHMIDAHHEGIDDLVAGDRYHVIGFTAPLVTSELAPPELSLRLLIYPTRSMTGTEILACGSSFVAFADEASAVLRERFLTLAGAS